MGVLMRGSAGLYIPYTDYGLLICCFLRCWATVGTCEIKIIIFRFLSASGPLARKYIWRLSYLIELFGFDCCINCVLIVICSSSTRR